ncbi:ThiF family adenylyltransferase [Comamonas testosteroni]|uniref:ThiF family adenylyltransferase n=1 Tax=Comamonas testosteroni TaxID=285 RepID=UPI0026E94195|nr:ThiF family adenylyltransferase [Comamonas testosteroni]
MTGQELPEVFVRLPPGTPQVLPHIGANGFVCFASRGTLVLDIFDLPGQILGCLDRATHVLDLSLSGGMQNELEDEFFAYWGGELCFLDVEPGSQAPLTVMYLHRLGCAFASGDVTKTRKKLYSLPFWVDAEILEIDGFQITTQAKPRPTQSDWPPRTIAKLLEWQELLDPLARRKVEQKLIQLCIRGKTMAFCLVKSPLMQYAFFVTFSTATKQSPSHRLANARQTLLSSRVHSMRTIRIDDHYLSQRNTPGCSTLEAKRIALIGCGTIGGFLAELLVKAGAGLGGGQLTLVDHDTLMPHNVGRHRLGLNHSLQKKSIALKKELTAGAPTADVRALPVSIQEAELGPIDLLIDATGEEGLSTLLAKQFSEAFVPTLTVWIEGPGIAVRALMRDCPEAACVRCLCAAHGEQLFPVVQGAMPEDLAGHGCENLYVPFPATVSVQAACLAAEMVKDWLSADCSPRLRTRVTGKGYAQSTVDMDVPKRHTCPACVI